MSRRAQSCITGDKGKRISPRLAQRFAIGQNITEAKGADAVLPCPEEFAAAALPGVQLGEREAVARSHYCADSLLGLFRRRFRE
jgi:hypothetical protein